MKDMSGNACERAKNVCMYSIDSRHLQAIAVGQRRRARSYAPQDVEEVQRELAIVAALVGDVQRYAGTVSSAPMRGAARPPADSLTSSGNAHRELSVARTGRVRERPARGAGVRRRACAPFHTVLRAALTNTAPSERAPAPRLVIPARQALR
jgi:hypothetical protein